ncbi:trans-aconitate methyltransferase 1 [Coemansia erecta]|uniref:Trans-aconitate methyltransferase 1 n=1 Tax=Coemansia erecta TaxID=147472 RepID=A0A9W7Y7R1_9FUNG|nr:trans-aconitate methyltransferase 1 [Coemansia erecta]
MATYSTPAYNSANYQADRPRYRDSLVDRILDFHKKTPGAATDLAVDVATGTGIFARQLQRGFTKVIGTDISENMLDSARKADAESEIEYVQSPAERLSFLEDHSVDVITVATGAHWIEVDKFVAEAKRVLKPTGSFVIFGYPGFAHFVDYPQCDKMLKDYGLGDDKLGSYWDAGRELLVAGYRRYHQAFVNNNWSDISRRIYPDTFDKEESKEIQPILGDGPVVMDFQVTWRTLLAFLKTWSTLAIYHKKYPERENAADVIVREMMSAAGATDMDEKLNIEWEEVLLMAHPPSQ